MFSTVLELTATFGFLRLAQCVPETSCYWPDHSPAYNQTPCNAQASVSWCCYFTDICLSNGMCLQQSNVYTNRLGRGSCTDSTWSSPACPQYCADVAPGSSTGIYLAYDTLNGAFCCGRNYNQTTGQCMTGTQGSKAPFNISPGEVIYNRANGALLTPNPTETSAPSAAFVLQNSTATVTASATSCTTASAGSSSVATIAAAISVPLGVLLLAALAAVALLLGQNRKLRRGRSQQAVDHATPNMTAHTPSTLVSPYEYKQQSQPSNVVQPYQYKQPPHWSQQVPINEAPTERERVEMNDGVREAPYGK
ncbi:hypothetical protein BAUCODRAFT_121349 [Baudoinia panamericana UAMH 10762]|uniref:Mid2 domain-containing protein n=1 Tax=Baudoinia panamericana (strain UAMH 10762) TaxID=717646 RepID=M2MP52_BAUPA|nr:uncharacterized protein BAUCODRAFT_121349 [Baudoinia panamericana UAMH 10762]EMC98481.1 hypothetical protein BAUCODRAFT_121349 [Baudoinia panamericana UAMH 10762]